MNLLANIIVSVVASTVIFLGGVNLPSKYLSLPMGQNFGNVGYTAITTATNLASFPSIYNTNATNFDNGKIDVGTTSLPTITTLANLVTVGTLTSGALSTGFTAVPVSLGGTGTTSPTSNLLMLGNGSSGLKTVNGFGTSGQFLQSNGDATAPSWTTSAIDETGSYNFTGTTFRVKNLHASSTAANPIVLNGVSYSTPSSQGAATTTLMNNGSGVLTWNRPDGMLIASTTLTSAVATTTLTIPSSMTDLYIVIDNPSTSAGSALNLQFNADTSGNYGSQSSTNSAAVVAQSSKSNIALTTDASAGANGNYCTLGVTNPVAFRKFLNWECSSYTSSGSASGQIVSGGGVWNNTTSRITSVSIGSGLGGATLGVGTRISVYSSQY